MQPRLARPRALWLIMYRMANIFWCAINNCCNNNCTRTTYTPILQANTTHPLAQNVIVWISKLPGSLHRLDVKLYEYMVVDVPLTNIRENEKIDSDLFHNNATAISPTYSHSSRLSTACHPITQLELHRSHQPKPVAASYP